MLPNLTILGMLIGGVGLFLLAVGMITDGLKEMVGARLRDILGQWTQAPIRGVMLGVGITALLQSSSAVTVATIGFVNAGLLSLRQALGVIYGTNIGTTMTGWLVAMIGFNINVEAFALPLIGAGMLLRLTQAGRRLAAAGTAMAGFGLFFIGIDVLKEAFDGMAEGFNLVSDSPAGFLSILLYVGIGFLMTMLTQSSSAAIAIILTAATGGMVSIESAAAMVIGANVGTTSTAAFAVIGATSNAKRVATAHVIFNLMTGVVALLILPLLFWWIRYTSELMGLADNPAVTLALFHTVFNVLGVLLLWPLMGSLSHFLELRFRSVEEVKGRPKFIDSTVMVSPALALNAVILELANIGDRVRQMSGSAISTERAPDKLMSSDFVVIDMLASAIREFEIKLGKTSLPQDVAMQLPKTLYALQCYITAADMALNFARQQVNLQIENDPEVVQGIEQYKQAAAHILTLSNPQEPDFDKDLMIEAQKQYHEQYRSLREVVLLAASLQRIDNSRMSLLLDQLYRLDRLVKQVVKAADIISGLLTITHFPITTEERQQQKQQQEAQEQLYTDRGYIFSQPQRLMTKKTFSPRLR